MVMAFNVFILFFLLTKISFATNGLNQIGFGAESIGMAGADIAVARDTSALNTNPAGLIQIRHSLLDMNLAAAYAGNIKHEDQFGNSVNNSNEFPVLGSIGYAYGLADYPVTVGIGMFAQGGTGNEYKNLNTAFGTTDNLSVQFRVLRITPGIAWQVNGAISLGVSIIGTYADLEQEVFPGTSYNDAANPSQSFYGFRLTEMNDFNTGFKLGGMFRINEETKIGFAYTSKVKLELKGKMTANLSALNLGNVTYQNAVAKNMDQPEEFGIGLAYDATNDMLISLELNWINWSEAITVSVLEASHPDNLLAPPNVLLATRNNWIDQYVVSIGAAYQWSEETLVRAGYNYGRNPIPNKNLNPLFNTIAEHHLTFGYGHKLNNEWHTDGAFEWDIRNKESYTNEGLFFGQNATATGELFAFHFSISRTW